MSPRSNAASTTAWRRSRECAPRTRTRASSRGRAPRRSSGVASRDVVEPGAQRLSELARSREELRLGHDVERPRALRRTRADCRRTFRRDLRADRVHHLGAARHAGERKPAADRLSEDGHGPARRRRTARSPTSSRCARRRTAPRPTPTGSRACGRAPAASPGSRAASRGSPLALHRLDDDARDRRRVDVRLEQVLERCDRVVGGDPVVRVRARRAVDLRRERAEAGLVRLHLARHRHREERPAVEGVVEGDDRGATGGPARDLHGVLDRLGAGVHEDRALLAAAARRQLGQPPAHLHVRLVDADHEALVQVAVRLLLDRLDDRGVPVARVLAPDPAREVDERAPVRIGDARALGVRDDERRRRHPGSDVARAVGAEIRSAAVVSVVHRAIISPRC